MNNRVPSNLIEIVLKYSCNDIWNEAVKEWDIVDCYEADDLSGYCICGKQKIRYQFTIQNRYNRIALHPIGSHCIKKFERQDMNETIGILESVFKLDHAIKDNSYLSLFCGDFSRKLLNWLHEGGAFDTAYNNYHGEADYDFMLKMFNKRNKDDISIRQHKKITAILLNSIRPFFNRLISNNAGGFMDQYFKEHELFKNRRHNEHIEMKKFMEDIGFYGRY